jgi:uncharacterized protein YukJ
MALSYGFVKCKVAGKSWIKPLHLDKETQYHLHIDLAVQGATSLETWDAAINVGTNDADDLLRYRVALDFHHPITRALSNAPSGFNDLTKTRTLPALDVLRSDILAETGRWRDSDVMDGETNREPYATLARLLDNAYATEQPVYLFGRTYTTGHGVHDVHMNQGSSGRFLNTGADENDHNDIWQDGAVIIEQGNGRWAAYFSAFTKQSVPTDALGNPTDGAHEITDVDSGSNVE